MAIELNPADIGLGTFPAFRDIQLQALEQVMYDERRFQVLAMPTGSGKSLLARAAMILRDERAVVLTSTKGLEDQYVREFGQNALMMKRLGKRATDGLVDIRGRANYQCDDFPKYGCSEGQYMGCKHNITCPYTDAMTDALHSKAVVTNYAFWFNINRTGRGLDPPQLTAIQNPRKANLLILDEAHLAPAELSGFLAVTVTERELHQYGLPVDFDADDLRAWKNYASDVKQDCSAEVTTLKAKILLHKGSDRAKQDMVQRLKILMELASRMDSILKMDTSSGGWIVEERVSKHSRSSGRYWTFDPVWPGLYAENKLFVGIPKVILVSATLRPKTMGLLGVKAKDYTFREWPRVFPKYRSPVYHLPTVRMSWRTGDKDKAKWLARIDQIIESRGPQRKGIIHTVSYARQQYILERSKYSRWMMANTQDKNSDTAAQVVSKFKAAKAPCILLSPSFGTGWDFPGDECTWQIIVKIPFPDSQSKVMKARASNDPQYMNYLAMQDLVQTCGRGMRFEGDRCETFIVDDNVSWFLWMSKGLAPSWFTVTPMVEGKLPPLPPALPA